MVDTPFKRPRTAEPCATTFGYHGNNIASDAVEWHIRELLAELQQAITSKQRVNILRKLLHFVGYDPSTRLCRSHVSTLSRLVEGKCIHLLCLQLGYAIGRRCFDHATRRETRGSNEEVFLILTAVDLFYRYCPELVTDDSIRTNGAEVLRLSQEVFINNRNRGITSGNTSKGRGLDDEDSSENFLPIVSIWHSCSSYNIGTILLLQHPGTLLAIHKILSWKRNQAKYDVERIGTIMECLGLLKNLTYFGEDHRHQIVNQPNLLTTLTSLTDIPDDKSRERLSAVFRNLALSTDVRSQLTQKADVLTAIVRMANLTYTNSSNNNGSCDNIEMVNSKRNTLRNLLSTVASLAMDSNVSHLMVFHGDGILIEQLKQFLMHSDDAVLRKRASRTLRLLASDSSVAPVMVLKNNQLLEILTERALNDPNDTVRTEATEAFAKCANLIQATMAQHSYILDVLTHMLVISASKTREKLDVVARTLHEQASHQVNRGAMIRRRNLLTALASVIVSEDSTFSVKESACNTLMNLSEEECLEEGVSLPVILGALVQTLVDQPNRTPLGTNSNNIIANAARATANINIMATNRIRESSVRTLLNLAKTPSNRTSMAKQTALIQSLLRFAAAATTSDDLKKHVKAAILQLAAEL